MDDSQTYADPDPPRLGQTVNFTLGGLWTQPVDIDYIEFQCHLFGVLVYDESFPDPETVEPGSWSYTLPFDVPPVAPSTTYYITISGHSTAGDLLFSINTDFKFA